MVKGNLPPWLKATCHHIFRTGWYYQPVLKVRWQPPLGWGPTPRTGSKAQSHEPVLLGLYNRLVFVPWPLLKSKGLFCTSVCLEEQAVFLQVSSSMRCEAFVSWQGE